MSYSSADAPGLALVGDFGGTNARLALADLSGQIPLLAATEHFHTKDFVRPIDIVTAFLKTTSAKPALVVIAAAGPVSNRSVTFTNIGWTISESELLKTGFSHARIINDFVALAHATKSFHAADLHPIGSAAVNSSLPVAVIGPGTGFGASALIVDESGRSLAMAAEGGHASFAPDDETEIEILRYLLPRLGHVSIERILSGPGLQNLHMALNAIEGREGNTPESEEITRRALAGEPICLRSVRRFCAILGSVAGNFALTYGALGGVFIAGGIAPVILPILEQSDFRLRFETKGRLAHYLRPIATAVITHGDAALLGAARLAMEISGRAHAG